MSKLASNADAFAASGHRFALRSRSALFDAQAKAGRDGRAHVADGEAGHAGDVRKKFRGDTEGALGYILLTLAQANTDHLDHDAFGSSFDNRGPAKQGYSFTGFRTPTWHEGEASQHGHQPAWVLAFPGGRAVVSFLQLEPGRWAFTFPWLSGASVWT